MTSSPGVAGQVLWVLLWLGAIAIVLPGTALGYRSDRRGLASDWAGALLWTWLTVAIAVPLAAAIGAFNWVTALVIAVLWPVLLWCYRHHRNTRAALLALVRRLVLSGTAIDPGAWRLPMASRLLLSSAFPLVAAPLVTGVADIRLPAPPDFDTLGHMQVLLGNAATWDPLASLGALLVRVSTVSPLVVTASLRFSLTAVAALAVATLVTDVGTSRRIALVAAVALTLAAPVMPVSVWAVLVVALLGTVTMSRWIRSSRAADGWHTAAACALLVGQLAPLTSNPAWVLTRHPRFVEPPAAPLQALSIARANSGDDWLIVAPPQLRLESGRPDRHYDLATFVERFADRAADRHFRFAVPVERIYLFVELESADLDLDVVVKDSRMVSGEAAVYRVPRERRRLQALARQLCDDYRRSHAGVRITHDDGALRICEITV